MKKIITLFLALALTLSLAPCAFAKTMGSGETQVQHLDDGSYIETTITETPSLFNGGVSLLAATTTKTKTKTSKFYNSSDALIWQFSVKGTFTYGNGSSKCTASSVSGTSYNKYIVLSDRKAWKSGNTAYASIVSSNINPLIPVYKKTYSLSLSCSAKGVFS